MKKLLLLLLCCLPWVANAQPSLSPLPEAEAFILNTSISQQNLTLDFKIAPGYYLYQKRFHAYSLTSKNNVSQRNALTVLDLPIGQDRFDPINGGYTAYANHVRLMYPLSAKTSQLEIAYQGCSESGFCYPPIKRYFNVSLEGKRLTEIYPSIAQANPLEKVTRLFNTEQFVWILLSFFGFGLLLTFTPCVLPMIPILSGILLGHGTVHSKRRGFVLALAYVLGMACAYALLGLLVASVGGQLQASLQRPVIIVTIASVFVLLAIGMLGLFSVRLPAQLQNGLNRIQHMIPTQRKSGVFLLGMLAALAVSPCVTPPLVGALTFVAESGNQLLGASALFTMGLGAGAPLILFATLGSHYLPKAGHWMYIVNKIFALLLLGVAITLFARIIPPAYVLYLWAVWCMIAAGLLGILRPLQRHWQGWCMKSVAISLLCYAGLLSYGASLGYANPLAPWQASLSSAQLSQQLGFKFVDSSAAVTNALRAQSKPALLDFYASWCASCEIMLRHTMTHAHIRALLDEFNLLQADITANSDTDITLMRQFNVIAPPTLIFFDKNGTILPAFLLVGEPSVDAFAKHLARVLAATKSA